MRVGPSGSACRSWFQTTLSCIGKEPLWWALRKRRNLIASGMDKGDERKRTIDEVSKASRCRQNWGLTVLQDKFKGHLFTAWTAAGIEMAWPLFRLLCGTWEPVAWMLREKHKWKPHKCESTEARHRGGSARSSDEVSVMEMERRGWHVQNRALVNQKWEELKIYANLVICKGHEEPYEARVSCTDLWEPEGEVPSGDSTS